MKYHWVAQQVNINLNAHDEASRRQLKPESHDDKEKMEPWKSVLEHWTDQPLLTNHLHIIAKVPGEWD